MTKRSPFCGEERSLLVTADKADRCYPIGCTSVQAGTVPGDFRVFRPPGLDPRQSARSIPGLTMALDSAA